MVRKWALFLGLCCSVLLHGAEILVWDMDMGSTILHLPSQRRLGTEKPVVQSLKRLGHSVTMMYSLPENLSDYDAVFVMLGYLSPS